MEDMIYEAEGQPVEANDAIWVLDGRGQMIQVEVDDDDDD